MRRIKRIVVIFIIFTLLFVSDSGTVIAASDLRLYCDKNDLIVFSESAQSGKLISAEYKDSRFVSASVSNLDLKAYAPVKFDISALGDESKLFFLNTAFVPFCAARSIAETLTFGTLQISCNLQGADVYIDGIRYEEDITPCLIAVESGTHLLEVKVPGYKTYSEIVKVDSNGIVSRSITLEPDFEPADIILTVNVGDGDERENLYAYEMDFEDKWLTLSEAVYIVQHDLEHSYCIRFADTVSKVSCGEYSNLEITAPNLTIDGITGRTKKIIFDYYNASNQKFILVRPTSNFTLYAVEIDTHNVLSIRPEDNTSTPESYENIKVLGCTFKNAQLLPFGGACKFAGVSGKTDYTGLYICGNTLENSYTFFAYSGDCDNSVTDGLYMCANTLKEGGYISSGCADCNTWYIYGEGSEVAGETPSTSDGNTVRNVLISGNQGEGKTGEGFYTIGAGIMGSSNNTVENVVIRNNYFADNIHFQVAQIGDHHNIGNTMITSGNKLRNIEFAYNKLDDKDENTGSSLYLHAVAHELDMQPETKFYQDNNSYETIIFHHNLYTGKEPTGLSNIAAGVSITNLGSDQNDLGFPVSVGIFNQDVPAGVTVMSEKNNGGSGVSFFMNQKINQSGNDSYGSNLLE